MSKSSPTILVVEDDTYLSRALIEKLSHEQFSALHASDGVEGLDLALARHPDLILLDILMPSMDGIQMMKKLREDAWGKTVPIIILTNLAADDKTRRTIVNDHHVSYLVKSDESIENIIDTIQKTLKKPPVSS